VSFFTATQIYIKQNQKNDFKCNSIVDIKKATPAVIAGMAPSL